MRKYVAIGTACAALAMAGCDGGKGIKADKVPTARDSIAGDSLGALSRAKIFFGHQSVGWNIIDGLKDVSREMGWAGFEFVETRTAGDAPGFYHSAIGQNEDPLGKIDDFEAIMRSGMGDKVDIALMKLCYVDFEAGTDAAAVFAAYRDAMNGLAAEYPKVRFVWTTAPLTTEEAGLKGFAKRILGKSVSAAENKVRGKFNELIRAECEDRHLPLFDIAAAESDAPSSSRSGTWNRSGERPSLRREFSNDGGHLNESGRKAVAESAIRALAAALPAR
jgi:hypothetical protein